MSNKLANRITVSASGREATAPTDFPRLLASNWHLPVELTSSYPRLRLNRNYSHIRFFSEPARHRACKGLMNLTCNPTLSSHSIAGEGKHEDVPHYHSVVTTVGGPECPHWFDHSPKLASRNWARRERYYSQTRTHREPHLVWRADCTQWSAAKWTFGL
ncbi:hypothetical protein RRG08_012663 [Elysia crispata]|uniref:Uncharacterized protein n=1 Tax=Elysia crispata TaxID=231223 RepID=A0AAE0YPD3_9GAST|nr:hypothetical protein RRG08_012663 [Elysia crispata]